MYFRIKAINTGYWTCCFLNLHTYHGAASYPTLSGNSHSVEDEWAQPQTAFPYHFYSVEKTSPWLRKHHQCWENITRVYRQPNTGFLKVRVIFGYSPWKGLTCKCYLCLHGNRIIIKYFDHIYETIQISFSTSSIRLMRLLDWFQYHINHIHETMKKPLCPLRPVYKKTEVLGLFSWYLSGQASKTSLVG